ncbi:hypothetical protein B9864_23010 [Salmonella enterica]|nr:hypothetical protein [Salmonella enterica]
MNRTRFNGGFFVAASPTRCRHFAATTKEKGATFSRNPLFYLVGWRELNLSSNWLFLKIK